jgi:hypothetical protein
MCRITDAEKVFSLARRAVNQMEYQVEVLQLAPTCPPTCQLASVHFWLPGGLRLPTLAATLFHRGEHQHGFCLILRITFAAFGF